MAQIARSDGDRLAGLSSAAREFFAYWDGLPKCDLVPRREQFDPVAVKHLLADIAILQYSFAEPPALIFRLAGTHHVQRWGHELTGRNYLDFVPTPRRPLAWRASGSSSSILAAPTAIASKPLPRAGRCGSNRSRCRCGAATGGPI